MKLTFNTEVIIPWPGAGTLSSDPNKEYRPWLEENVGRQGVDWEWDISRTDPGAISLRLSDNKKEYATFVMLKWAGGK